MNKKPERVKKLFEEFLNSKREVEKKLCEEIGMKYEDPFADVRYYTDKKMEYEHNDDASKGWTGVLSHIVDKTPEDTHLLLLVTFDGAGYDYFTYDSSPSYTDEFEKILKKKGMDIIIEHCNNWAFVVCEN